MALSRFVVTAKVTATWPASWAGPANNPPVSVDNQIGNPAAGAQFTYTVPAGPPVTLQAVNTTLVTSAAVANRKVLYQITDGAGHQVDEFQGTGLVPASTTIAILLTASSPQSANGTAGTSFGSCPAAVMQPGWQLVSVVNSMDAADQLSAITINTTSPPVLSNPPQFTWLPGTVIYADSAAGTGTAAQLLYQAIGAGNLRAFVPGQDDVGHAGLAN